MHTGIDILESELYEKYPGVLDTLLFDQTTQKNIFWATDNYTHLGEEYTFVSQILPHLIIGDRGTIIMPRVHKDKVLQQARSKERAEVFTPSWLCNVQNNSVDSRWFNRVGVFNVDSITDDGHKTWEVNHEKIAFPKGKTWKQYVSDKRLEVACGEAPYITSRYDTTTGEFIPVERRIGLLDRKIRVVNENVSSTEKWLDAVKDAFKSIYAFEWQGDSLLLAREAMLVSFIENFQVKFGKDPAQRSIEAVAKIISWNVWQMDGLKCVIPNSCHETIEEKVNLFGISEKITNKCRGCETRNIWLHNGIYCKIKDWTINRKQSGSKGLTIQFVDIFEK
ncbi:MAG: restriction endonuclease subunit M [Chitinophagaceae bacterium]|nr:MAG: restriction endonuclease subunit M [Chitinophagaceae bacterium]